MTIAIVGQGYMGRTHAQAWTELGVNGDIRYVVSRGRRPRDWPAPSAQFVDDFDVVLADEAIDVVSICTPTALHARFAIKALQAGKNVLVEKPIALTIEDGHKMIDAARRSGTTFMVAHVVRFFAGYELVRAIVDAEAIGAVHSVHAVRRVPAPEEASWMTDERQSGGVLVDLAIHDFDQANLFLGLPSTVSAARHRRDGQLRTNLTYPNGGTAEIITDAALPQGSEFSSSLRIEGSTGSVSYAFKAGSPSESPGALAGGLSTLLIRSGDIATEIAVPANGPYLEEVRYFLECQQLGLRTFRCPPESSLQALAVSLAASDSLRLGTPVPIA